MLQAIRLIRRHTANLENQQFIKDELKVLGVLHLFMMIGESSRAIPDEIKAQFNDINWTAIRGMRNVIVHNYERISLRELWDTIQKDLPPTEKALKRMQKVFPIPRQP